jgi:hypothetical protein
MAHKDDRFLRIHAESRFSGSNEIWVDTVTGVQYLFHASGYAGGLTPLLDEEGKPVVMPKFELENLIYNNR